MSGFLYKTRGGSSPQGKARVYFCCHPDDFERYLQPVCDEILQKQNCAVWYDAAGGRGDFPLDDLGGMQLFVIPVTARFLKEQNRARDIEFPFAMERHIPVLPLLQESGLEALFNQVCGDLQMLDKNNRDKTALSYDEKLEKFLASVLVGDELAARVRDAFDAYIFLSYRKKDRRYAQELMRLIHKNDFCRDIAIWYDEFLTPGENFNDAIADALRKSRLFALAITPNVVNEPNYVMSIEYPMARDSEKPVLPVELAPTDREALAESYAGLPECIRKDDEGALAESLRRIAIRENDSSPEHTFFIGLAYLAGIDVEVDHGRALSLITGAAEGGLPAAARKLAAMYRHGEGVGRDYRVALSWQQKLAGLLEAAFEAEPSAEAGRELLVGLWELGDFYRELGQRDEAKGVFEKIQDLSRGMSETVFADASGCRYFAIAGSQLSLLYMEDKQYEEAERCCRKGLLVLNLLDEEALSVEMRSDISILTQRLGLLCQERGQYGEAKRLYGRCLEQDGRLFEETGWKELRLDLSADLLNLGNVCCEEGEPEEARGFYERSLRLAREHFEEMRTPEAKAALARSYAGAGYLAQRMEDWDAAEAAYGQSAALFDEVARELETGEARRNAAKLYSMLAGVYYRRNKKEGLRDSQQKCVAYYRQVYEAERTPEAKRELALGLGCLGDMLKEAVRDWEAAEPVYREGAALFAGLCEELGRAEDQDILGKIYCAMGKLRYIGHDAAGAREYYGKGADAYRQAYRGLGTVALEWRLVDTLVYVADFDDAAGRLEEACQTYREALALCRKMRGEELPPEVDIRSLRKMHIGVCLRLADTLHSLQRLEEALEAGNEGLREALAFYEVGSYFANRVNLALAYEKCGRILYTAGRLEEALAHFAEEGRLQLQNAKEGARPHQLSSYCDSLDRQGEVCVGLERLEEAVDHFGSAVLYRKKVCSAQPGDVQHVKKYAHSCRRLADVCRLMGRVAEAQRFYDAELSMREEIVKEEETLETLDALALACYRLGTVDEGHGNTELVKQAFLLWFSLYKAHPENEELARKVEYIKGFLQ